MIYNDMIFDKNFITLTKEEELSLLKNNIISIGDLSLPVLEEIWSDELESVYKFEQVSYAYLLIIPIIFNSNFDYKKEMLVNAFVGLDEVDYKHVYFKYLKLDNKELEENFKTHPNFVENIDYEDYIIYKFKIPDKWLEDYSYCIDGKYSKISKVGKNTILGYLANEYGSETRNKFDSIFNKSMKYKHIIEEKIGEKLPLSAELYAVLNQELLCNYVGYSIQKTLTM